MGYNVIYEGKVVMDKPLDDETYAIINGLINTRRMQWDGEKLEEDGIAKVNDIGRWGEFFFEGADYSWAHVNYRKYLLRGNFPPPTQPSLYCRWVLSEDRLALEWDREEKAYKGHEWMKYLVKEILVPRGYHPKGVINWFTEDGPDEESENHTIVNGKSVMKRRGYSAKQKTPDVERFYKELHEEWRRFEKLRMEELQGTR